jgi:hypothetical protein
MEQWAANAGGKHALPCVQWLELPCRYATDVLQPPARVMARAPIIDLHHDVHWRLLIDGTLHILKCPDEMSVKRILQRWAVTSLSSA